MTALDHPGDLEFRLKRRRWTAAEVEWLRLDGFFDEDPLRYELLDGDLIEMSPQGPMHIELQNKLVSWIVRRLPSDIEPAIASPMRLGLRHEPEPDIFLYPAAMNVNRVRGSDAALVIEVSASSLKRDLGLKADIYRSQGVRLYWVLDIEAGATWVHTLPGLGYEDPRRVPFSEPLEVPGVAEPLVIADLLS